MAPKLLVPQVAERLIGGLLCRRRPRAASPELRAAIVCYGCGENDAARDRRSGASAARSHPVAPCWKNATETAAREVAAGQGRIFPVPRLTPASSAPRTGAEWNRAS